jgi:hypothetical protein
MPRIRRGLTPGERQLVRSVFGDAVDCGRVEIVHAKWFPFQPRNVTMAPMGNIHIHPRSGLWKEDFATESLSLQGFFIHEMTHVWQTQTKGRFYLVLMRHPFCRYGYRFRPGRPFGRYGIEQQAEMVRHAFLLRNGHEPANSASLADLEAILPFERD